MLSIKCLLFSNCQRNILQIPLGPPSGIFLPPHPTNSTEGAVFFAPSLYEMTGHPGTGVPTNSIGVRCKKRGQIRRIRPQFFILHFSFFIEVTVWLLYARPEGREEPKTSNSSLSAYIGTLRLELRSKSKHIKKRLSESRKPFQPIELFDQRTAPKL